MGNIIMGNMSIMKNNIISEPPETTNITYEEKFDHLETKTKTGPNPCETKNTTKNTPMRENKNTYRISCNSYLSQNTSNRPVSDRFELSQLHSPKTAYLYYLKIPGLPFYLKTSSSPFRAKSSIKPIQIY